jgi:hydroxypyruvate reductase/glycerate 2-kinase
VTSSPEALREHARSIWQAGVAAVSPHRLISKALRVHGGVLHAAILKIPLDQIGSIVVIGAGKAGAAMSSAVEESIGSRVARQKRLRGWVNVPNHTVEPLDFIHLHGARSAPDNKPTQAGVEGARQIQSLVESLGPRDVAICLISGGGSALLPAPVAGVTLAEKQAVTGLLHSCGATIGQLNAVRKHLSAIKGGGLVRRFHGKCLVSLIISDVVGDPLDVIASGPTAADRSTYRDAIAVLEEFRVWDRVPESIRSHLNAGAAGTIAETLKRVPQRVVNAIIGNNSTALDAAERAARKLGYRVLNLSSYLEGDSQQLGIALAGIVRGIRDRHEPFAPPACILCGGETTVSLGAEHGLGGRNQELVLAAMQYLGMSGLQRAVILSGGTDGEDGPTDAAGALVDQKVFRSAGTQRLDPIQYLKRHDSYHFFEQTGGLIKTGLTNTNVMDLRVALIAGD